MPLQNRVAPDGEIVAVAARGTFMGNRGCLHNEKRELIRYSANRRWITCLLEFKARRRVVMSPRRYTELFFLDEAVSLAAGHRPCAECRRMQFNAFKNAWLLAGNTPGKNSLHADEMDVQLHRTRIGANRRKITYCAKLGSLPEGTFVQIDESSYLVWGGRTYRWSAARYLDQHPLPSDLTVTVLTPKPIVECLRHGYKPEVHDSVKLLSSEGE